MDTVKKVFETAKAVTASAFAVFGIWKIVSPIGEGDVGTILQLLQALVVLIAGLIGGSAVSRLRRAFKEEN